MAEPWTAEIVAVSLLTPHPQNYKTHPPDQLSHIVASIRQHGVYRNILIARDNTILGGHGVVEACKLLDYQHVPVRRLDLDPMEPAALKVLAGDNQIGQLGDIDDRALSEVLKRIHDSDPEAGLLGTGYDPQMLAGLQEQVMLAEAGNMLNFSFDDEEREGFANGQQFGGGYMVLIPLPAGMESDHDLKLQLSRFCTEHSLVYRIAKR